MENRLTQKYSLFRTKTFELTDSGIKGQHKGLFDSTEYFVDFDDIGTRILKKRSGTLGWLLGACICVLLALLLFVLRVTGGKVGNDAEVFYLGIALICAVIFIVTYKKS